MNGNYLSPPIIKVEVESMKYGIMTALQDRHEELLKVVEAGIDAAIIEIPPKIAQMAKDMSEEILKQALAAALTQYWNNGGGREMLDKMIEKKFK